MNSHKQTAEKMPMKILDKAMRKDLVALLVQSDDRDARLFSEKLVYLGQYAEATEDEIEEFMALV